MRRLKTQSIIGLVACPKCGYKKSSVQVGTRSAYFRFYCGDCFYEFETEPKPFRGMTVTKGLIEDEN